MSWRGRGSIQAYKRLHNCCYTRSVNLPGTVGAAIPVEGSDKLLAFVGRRICIVDREKG